MAVPIIWETHHDKIRWMYISNDQKKVVSKLQETNFSTQFTKIISTHAVFSTIIGINYAKHCKISHRKNSFGLLQIQLQKAKKQKQSLFSTGCPQRDEHVCYKSVTSDTLQLSRVLHCSRPPAPNSIGITYILYY